MFLDSVETIKNVFLKYFDNERYLIVFIIALLILIVEEWQKENRSFLVYYTILMSAIILNPIFAYIISPFVSENVYYRLFWTIPVGIVMAYFGTQLTFKVDKKVMRVVIAIAFIGVIIYAGTYVYNDGVFEKVNNWYKVPDQYVEVTEIIGNIPIENKKAMVSIDMVGYIRQLDANIKLAFQRSPMGDYSSYEIVTYYNIGDVENLTKLCKESKINIIVYDNKIPLTISPISYGFELYAQTENYDIYVQK